MKLFKRFALLSTIGTYLVIFIGGLVRVSGAGLGCPDWPTCFGRWFPPTSIDQLPADFDPSQFNITLAWIEYINRLCGMFLGLLILSTALIAIFKHRDKKILLYGSMVAAVLVALIGLQGSKVITSELEPIVVTVHMLLAQVLGGLMIFVTYRAYNFGQAENLEYPAKTRLYAVLLGIIAVFQVVLGTQIRSALEILAKQFPLLSDIEWLAKVGGLNHTHLGLGMILAVLTGILGWKIFSYIKDRNIIKFCSACLMVLIGVQVIIGLTFVAVGMPELARVFHLWVASLFLSCLFLIYAATGKG